MTVKSTLEMNHCAFCVSKFLNEKREKPLALLALDMDGPFMGDDRFCSGSKLAQDILKTLKEKFPEKDKPGRYTWNDYEWAVAKARNLNDGALKNLKHLISTTSKTHDVFILLITAWRNDATLTQLREIIFKDDSGHHILGAEIIGKTQPNAGQEWAPEIEELKKQYTETGRKCDDIRGFLKVQNEHGFIYNGSRAEQITHWFKRHELDPQKTSFVILDDDDDGLSKNFPKNYIHVWDFLSESDVTKAMDILNKKMF